MKDLKVHSKLTEWRINTNPTELLLFTLWSCQRRCRQFDRLDADYLISISYMNLKLVLWLLLPFVLCRLLFLCLSCSMFCNPIGQRLNAESSKSMSVVCSDSIKGRRTPRSWHNNFSGIYCWTTCNTIYSDFKTREGTLSVSDTSETTEPSLRLCFLFSRLFWTADLWLSFHWLFPVLTTGGCSIVACFDFFALRFHGLCCCRR